jgi:hypothetical protein
MKSKLRKSNGLGNFFKSKVSYQKIRKVSYQKIRFKTSQHVFPVIDFTCMDTKNYKKELYFKMSS